MARVTPTGEVTDASDRLRVPPDHPSYTLRRVWLSDEEDKGYYEGFSNEGLWPLCQHSRTHVQSSAEDWLQYAENQSPLCRHRFAGNGGHGITIVLAQDYHLALLPRMIKEARPTPAWRSSGTFRGRIRKFLASAPGSANLWTVCSART